MRAGGSFRLVDVENRCLRSFNDEATISGLIYFALSYVWGQHPKSYLLTRKNIQRYHEPGGLGQLPKTISDALCVVKSLGHTYLWVDALCIIQDDPADYALQVPLMKDIYRSAYVTIIAAAGDSADSGLPGVNSDRCAMTKVDLGGGFAIVEVPPFSEGRHLNYTTWVTRAWTLQEFLLSTRCLVFVDERVYWVCAETEHLEDVGLHAESACSEPNFDGHVKISHNPLQLKNFKHLVEQYTTRCLTNPTDILDAFSGVLAAIPDTEFFWGIPTAAFGEHLLWDWDDKKLPERRGLGECPSWSWLETGATTTWA